MSYLNDGYKFYNEKLNSAKLILAPMVDQSELAWRQLSRKYGAQLCYTPMLHAAVFLRDSHYRKENFQTCETDRPLIAQFCSDCPDTFLNAARLIEDECDAIDLNLGCPQNIAKRGHYGSFLQDEWDLIYRIIENAAKNLKVPVTAKIRVFEDVNKTIEYARMLEKAGVSLLAVHGRLRDQKGPLTGLASWAHIKAVKDNVNIPVFANGNILHFSDINECLKQTGCDGVMVAEGNLYNPAIFCNQYPPAWLIVKEYLCLTRKYDTCMSAIKGHVYKICYKAFETHADYRDRVQKLRVIEEFDALMDDLQQICLHNQTELSSGFSYWQCQPRVRTLPALESQVEAAHKTVDSEKDDLKTVRLKRKADKALRKQNAALVKKSVEIKKKRYDFCNFCKNPKSDECSNSACRVCCRRICSEDGKTCPIHNRHKKSLVISNE
jgi:tRNA-dihydrouridine synthase 1